MDQFIQVMTKKMQAQFRATKSMQDDQF